MQVTDVVAQKTWHGAEGARMSVRFEEWSIHGHFAGIEADAAPRLFQAVLQVFFAGDEIKSAGLAFIRQDKVEERFERVFFLFGGDLRDGLAGELLQVLIHYRCDHYTGSAAS